MGGAVSTGADNDELVDNLKAADYIETALVERVFRAVDRGDYFTSECREHAYRDNAWKKGNLHLSAPCIYAKVMEGLQLAPGHAFLNLGSGTGYLSTMAGLILGPYGINHGVELHLDVVNYGRERLEHFKKHSPAVDAFSFCEPHFVQGNCLCLPPDVRLYDRVYCGASCPETHENYMKALIKEGGVLVMPLNDQLVKITRTGQSRWEVESLLPVSFSSLVMPDASHPPTTVNLPNTELMALQEICRQELRTLLRCNIEKEQPQLLTAANRPVQRAQRTRFPRISFPRIPPDPNYESDEDPRMTSDDSDDFFSSHRRNQISEVIEFTRALTGQRVVERERQARQESGTRRNESHEDDEDLDVDRLDVAEEDDDDDEESESDARALPPKDRKAKLFVGLTRVSFLKDVCKETKGEKTLEEPSSSVTSMPQSEPIPMASAPTTSVKSCKKREKFDSGVGEEIENSKEESSSDSDEGKEDVDEMEMDSIDSDYSENSPPRTKVTRLLDPEDPDCPCGGGCSGQWKHRKEDEEEEAKDRGEDKEVAPSPVETYSTLMREKISLLPLPHALKLYLNYHREL